MGLLKDTAYISQSDYSEDDLTTHTSLFGKELSSDDDCLEERGGKHRLRKNKKRLTKLERKDLKQQKRKLRQEKRFGKRRRNDDYSDNGSKVAHLKKLFEEAMEMIDGPRTLKFTNIILRKEDLEALLDDEWLDDNVIGFIYEYLNATQTIPTLRRRIKYGGEDMINNSVILLLPTFSFLLANDTNPLGLKDALPNLETASFIFMPVNDNIDFDVAEGGSHWSLILFCPKDRKAFIYDSLYEANETESLQLVRNTEKLLNIKMDVITDKHTPQQINGSDCGVLASAITALLLDRIINVEDNTMINLSLRDVAISAVDARIFILATIVGLMREEREEGGEERRTWEE
ncbi:DEKNAAC101900 [Brettanomyces naardenensis]|uniref:DEKNAAC101900 n=1 Tax=Brettanomyces naardenensis TaxID=13370 RepID=A0A448YJ32_BRENA|nr:DEKNAAC101900 [Brettanomyces naardenensis]